ncbi:MAG: hypothetical protein HC817_02790 [Saprospiraceae bacterium]|nr:hypothetical protein [Saprospiraceae bacterium]
MARPTLWNNYSASITHGRLPYELLPLDRGKRYFGTSKMNVVSLIVHGLSAISIYLEVVTVRLLLMAFCGICLSIFAIILFFHEILPRLPYQVGHRAFRWLFSISQFNFRW